MKKSPQPAIFTWRTLQLRVPCAWWSRFSLGAGVRVGAAFGFSTRYYSGFLKLGIRF